MIKVNNVLVTNLTINAPSKSATFNVEPCDLDYFYKQIEISRLLIIENEGKSLLRYPVNELFGSVTGEIEVYIEFPSFDSNFYDSTELQACH